MSPVRTSDVILLVVEAETGDAAEELALRHTVQRTFGVDDKGSPWRVERLFRATGPETTNLDRYFRVSGSVDAPSHRFEQAAFELAYRLSDATGFHVEPDLPSSSFAPPEPDFTEASGAAVRPRVRAPSLRTPTLVIRIIETLAPTPSTSAATGTSSPTTTMRSTPWTLGRPALSSTRDTVPRRRVCSRLVRYLASRV